MRFEGTSAYVATDDLKVAVNAAITLERPLLVKGEPGTGKTVLALEIAKSLNAPLIEWHVKVDHQGDAGSLRIRRGVAAARQPARRRARARHPQLHQARQLWDAFVAEERPVLLIDEIDKADIEFPNDLLLELDRMEFFVYETGETVKARRRPLMIITSNNEKDCPTRSCAAASSTTSAFPMPTPCGRSSRCISRHQAAAGRGGAEAVLRGARGAGTEEESRRPRSCSTGSSS
jgi:MoxR-like ATPase